MYVGKREWIMGAERLKNKNKDIVRYKKETSQCSPTKYSFLTLLSNKRSFIRIFPNTFFFVIDTNKISCLKFNFYKIYRYLRLKYIIVKLERNKNYKKLGSN